MLEISGTKIMHQILPRQIMTALTYPCCRLFDADKMKTNGRSALSHFSLGSKYNQSECFAPEFMNAEWIARR